MMISHDMMAQLEAARMGDFVNRAVKFVEDEFPHIAARADSAKLTELVKFSVDKARQYGFVSERDIVKYLSVIIFLGARFDEDPRFERVRLPLSGMPNTPPAARIEFLLTMVHEMRQSAYDQH